MTPQKEDSFSREKPMAMPDREVRRSKCRFVMNRIREFSRHESEPISDWSFIAREFGESW